MKKNFYENPLPREWVEAFEAVDRDPEEQRRFAGQSAGLDYIWANFEQLRDRYPRQWVAARNQEIAGHADDLDALLRDLETRGIAPSQVSFQFMWAHDAEFIL